MLAFRGQMLEVEGELSNLRAKLEQYANSIPSKKIDPNLIDPTQYANRHKDSFNTASFLRFKDEIEQAKGNVQPILVRQKLNEPGRFEIVFGHRRHMACKELGIYVLASICIEYISDIELFSAMDRENRGRAISAALRSSEAKGCVQPRSARQTGKPTLLQKRVTSSISELAAPVRWRPTRTPKATFSPWSAWWHEGMDVSPLWTA
jgi:hypothetical protein